MKKILFSLLVFINVVFITGCDNDDDPAPPPTIVISGVISSAADASLIESAQVSILNIETQQNALDTYFTDVTGAYSFTVSPGSYEVRVSAQGYASSPLDGLAGIPISTTQTNDVALETIASGTYGSLNMQLVGYANTAGALTILTNTISSKTYTAVTSNAGALIVYNLPAGDYELTIKSIGHETYVSATNVTIVADTETAITDITLTATTGFTIGGTVTFLAVGNSEVDVSLTDQGTGVVIPGTNVITVSSSYSIAAVAPGSYNILATSKVDGLVVDPDSIVKFGQPSVTVVAANITDGDIDVTGAVSLTSPILQTTGAPAVIDNLNPTLSWTSYSSTSDYVVEVLDVNGTVIWGGFSTDGLLTKLVTTTETTIGYSNDGLGQILVDGETYRWKVYASKDANTATPPWNLISSSEDAQGIFTVVIP